MLRPLNACAHILHHSSLNVSDVTFFAIFHDVFNIIHILPTDLKNWESVDLPSPEMNAFVVGLTTVFQFWQLQGLGLAILGRFSGAVRAVIDIGLCLHSQLDSEWALATALGSLHVLSLWLNCEMLFLTPGPGACCIYVLDYKIFQCLWIAVMHIYLIYLLE